MNSFGKIILAICLLVCLSCCRGYPNNDLKEIKKLICSVNSPGDELTFCLSDSLVVINGGEPPKYFDKFGLDIESTYEKDIVLIQFRKNDTIGLKVPMNDLFNRFYIHCNSYKYPSGSIITVFRKNDRDIILN